MPTSASIQAPCAVVMVRPHRFWPNPHTAHDNAFQAVHSAGLPADLARRAHAEVTEAAAQLDAAGVRVHLFDDLGERDTPDAVFPNNWFSTHADGRVALYPMYAPSRRRERRADIIERLRADYEVREVVDYSAMEDQGQYLEGTGAMVLDHAERVAYVGSSARADAVILERFCTAFGYEPMVFPSADPSGRPIYHTNVLMSIGSEVALVCLEAISEPRRRTEVAQRLVDSGRELVELSWHQVTEFAGNAMELRGDRPLMVLSERALASLDPGQRVTIEASCDLLPLRLPTIELAGGSARCMMAGIHLSRR